MKIVIDIDFDLNDENKLSSVLSILEDQDKKLSAIISRLAPLVNNKTININNETDGQPSKLIDVIVCLALPKAIGDLCK